MLKKSLID